MISVDLVFEELGPLVRSEEPPAGWEQKIVDFLAALTDWNQRVNLVSRATVESTLVAHVLPSLATLLLVAADREARVLDVGSGGGFPGIPLRILRPRVRLDLVDATRKKCRFLEHCVAVLGLEDTRVHWCRVESPSPELRSRAPFDLAIARAVGDGKRIAAATRPLLGPDGQAWVFASPEEAVSPHRWADAEGRVVTGLLQIV